MNDSTLMDLIQQEIPGCICPTDPQASNPVLGNRFAHNAPVMLEM